MISQNKNFHYCIGSQHSKGSISKALLEATNRLLKLEQSVNSAQGEELKQLEAEIAACKSEVEKLKKDDKQRWAPISNELIRSHEAQLARVVEELQGNLEDLIAENRTEEAKALQVELARATEMLENVIEFYKSPYGKAYLSENSMSAFAFGVFKLSGGPKKSLPMLASGSGANAESLQLEDLPTAADILAYLDERIHGQGFAKAPIASEISDHYCDMYMRNNNPEKYDDDEDFQKANILLIGPTGCGKTALLSALRKCLSKYMGEIPLVSMSATKFSETGYVGANVEDLIEALYFKAEKSIRSDPYNKKLTEDQIIERAVQAAEMGIVHVDEIDKLSNKGDYAGGSVSRQGVQNALLTLLEDSTVNVQIKKGPQNVINVPINTSKIIFFASGAFAGTKNSPSVYEISEKKSVGAQATNGDKTHNSMAGIANALNKHTVDSDKNYENGKRHNIESSDVVEYGLSPELAGRFPLIATLDELSEYALRRIMTDVKGATLPYLQKRIKRLHNIEIDVKEDALVELAKRAKARGTGARAIPNVVKTMLFPITTFPEDYKGCKVVINKESLTNPSKMVVTKLADGSVVEGGVKPLEEKIDTSKDGDLDSTTKQE